MPDKQKARDNLKATTSGASSADIALLTLAEVFAFVGVEGLSGTFVRNLQRSLVAQAKRQESQEIADDVVTRMRAQFPDIAAIPKRNRTIKIWLDGIPEETDNG